MNPVCASKSLLTNPNRPCADALVCEVMTVVFSEMVAAPEQEIGAVIPPFQPGMVSLEGRALPCVSTAARQLRSYPAWSIRKACYSRPVNSYLPGSGASDRGSQADLGN